MTNIDSGERSSWRRHAPMGAQVKPLPPPPGSGTCITNQITIHSLNEYLSLQEIKSSVDKVRYFAFPFNVLATNNILRN